jgi:starch-binding outer membrane protein, SusD/RagB family
MTQILTHRFRRAGRRSALALAVLAVGACSIQDSLLEQQQPQVIKPSDVQNATGAVAIYNGVLGRLRTSLNGGDVNTESIWNWVGLMSDEFRVGDTFSQRIDADQRRTQDGDQVLITIYNKVQQSRGYARDAINSLNAYAPLETSKIAEMYFVMGIMEATLGQNFCNGIPLGETVNGVPAYTAPLTNAAVFAQAIARYDTALTLLTGTDAQSVLVRTATRIAKARAQVALGQFAAAATTVAGIPTTYAYLITYSQQTQSNEWWTMAASSKRYVVGDTVDGTATFKNNLPFHSAADPRVKSTRTSSKAFDTITPYDSLGNWGREDAISLVNGLDARLIEAEAQLNLKTPAGWTSMMAILNALRTTPPKYGNFTIAAMTPLADPTSQVEAENVFFREKAFWQYSRGERLGDLRRLVRQYGRGAETVFPTGSFFKGGAYGTNVAFPVPDAEKSNPNFTGCLDRSA